MNEHERQRGPEFVDLFGLAATIDKGELTREVYDGIRYKLATPGESVEKFLGHLLTFDKIRWSEDGRLLPNYERIGQKVKLAEDEQEALRQMSQSTGLTPQDALKGIIREGLGFSEQSKK